jgi:hypothetical protein
MTYKKYNLELLNQCIIRDNAKIFENYDKLNSGSIINFQCNCGISNQAKFRSIVEQAGMYCKQCKKINQQEKVRNTSKEIFGYEYASQSPEFQEKVKNTNIDKFINALKVS